eukprot:symbB.v1.2.020947.t1/scaffold1788.1/size101334/2
MHWIGLPDFDQSAFDQSIIEFLDLWRNAWTPSRPTSDFSRSAKCVSAQMPWLDSQSMLDLYFDCWHGFVQSFFGSFGQRGGEMNPEAPVWFLNPEIVDVNYVVGGRSTTDDPLVWHLAGRLKSQSNEQGEKFMDIILKNLWHIPEERPS